MKSEIYEINRIGIIDDYYEIYIETDDIGDRPHFHIRDIPTKGKNFHTCIRLDKKSYFHHTRKTNIMNTPLRKKLMEFLLQQYRTLDMTNWNRIVSSWNDNNPDASIDEHISMPNYKTLSLY